MKRLTSILLVLGLAISALGCAQAPLKFPTPTGDKPYEVLGEGHGAAAGVLLFQVIPIQYNSRFIRAQQAAIESKGGDALINPVVTENWWWAYIMNGATTTVTGTVIKYKQ